MDKNRGITLGGLVLFGVIVYLICNYVLFPETYMAIWDDPRVLSTQSRHFDSKESCLEWIHKQKLVGDDITDYECGKNCDPPKTELGSFVCDETYE